MNIWSHDTTATKNEFYGDFQSNMKSTLSSVVIDAFKRQGARWGGDYTGRKDPMHLEFVHP